MMFVRNILLSFGILLLSSIVFIDVTEAKDTFPKLANYFLRWDIRAGDVAALAKYDVLVLDIEVQYKTRARLLEIKKINPDIIILAYITPQEITKNASTVDSRSRRTLGQGIDNSWYAKDASGNRLSYWPGTYVLNMSNASWTDFLVDFIIDQVASQDVWDGVFYDNAWEGITWFTNSADLDNNGRVDSNPDAAWRLGMEKIYRNTRTRTDGDFIIIANGHTGGYQSQLNGKLIEQFQTHHWGTTMGVYRDDIVRGKNPNYTIINANTLNTGNQSDYQLMRYGLTSSLLEDGYYSFDHGDQNHGQNWWYDEYSVELGEAISGSVSEAGGERYTADVWRRDFEHGVAVVNSTNQTKHVSLAGEYEKIHGTQDTRVNDGSIVEEVTLPAEDGVVLLKTFEDIEDIVFTNGEFARFFRPDGSRARNGIFLFTEGQLGGVQIGRIDLNFNGKPELILVRGGRVDIYRDDGQLYSRFHPYGGNYEGELRIAIGDLWGIRYKELFIAPSDGYPAPIKSYSYDGRELRDDWFPFGDQYTGGYSLAVGRFSHPLRNHLAVGAGIGQFPSVHVFDHEYHKTDEWFAYDKSFRGGIFLATGDTNGDGLDEVITGPGPGMKPLVRVFSYSGLLQSEFLAYSTFSNPGIRVQTADLDFDGKDDIVGLSSGVGL